MLIKYGQLNMHNLIEKTHAHLQRKKKMLQLK